MNEDLHNESNDTIAPELEVRLLAMLQGEASDFERDQLEQLMWEHAEVAAAYEQLRALHGCLIEVGTGEIVGWEDEWNEWKLSAARRDRVLAVFSGAAAVDDPLQPVFVAQREHRKWMTRPFSKSFVSVVTVVGLIGIVGALFMPGVQMARKSQRWSLARVDPAESFESLLQGRNHRTFDSNFVAPAPATGTASPLSAEAHSNAPSDALESAKLQLQETLSSGLPTPYYLNDDVQYVPTPLAVQPPQPSLSKKSTVGQDSAGVPVVNDFAVTEHYYFGEPGITASSSHDSPSRGPVTSSHDSPSPGPVTDRDDVELGETQDFSGGMRGIDGEMAGEMGGGLRGSWANEDLGRLAAPTRPADTTELPQNLPALASPNAAGRGVDGLDSLALNLSDTKQLGDQLRELPQLETEALSRSEQLARPRIIITDEKVADKEAVVSGATNGRTPPTESWYSGREQGFVDGLRVEGAGESAAAPPPANNTLAYSPGSPLYDLGQRREENRAQDQQAAATEVARRLLEGAASTRLFGTDGRTAGRVGQSFTPEQLADAFKNEKAALERGRQGLSSAVELAGKPTESQMLREELAEAEYKVVPAPQAPEQGLEELSATEEAFSTFSLHVSDVSFKLALMALSQGQWPAATRIRIEEFVNAFDYGDPLPTTAEKVACQLEQAIHPFLMQRNVLRVSMRTAATGRSGSTPLRLTLLLDNSGSMERADRRQTLRRAFEALIEQLKPTDQVTLISFANRPRLLADRVRGDQATQLLQIIETLPSEGGTNIEAALQLAMEKATEHRDPDAQDRIVLLTDGAVNLGDANPEHLSAIVTTLRDAGIAFDAAGISAHDLNDEVLEALTRQGDGRYYLLDSAEATSDGFADQIAGALRPSAKNVKVQIEFNPQRVGQYKLLGFEKHRLQTEDFRDDQVDAAEMAAAEAGVAVYQFEAKPDGTGDVGSVSVRFRDLATGQMVERTWPIPYVSHPPRLEEASASLRIAAAAALLAAKLQGQALGAAVNLQTVATWIAELPAAERSQIRVQQLQSMIAIARQLESSRQ